MAYDNGKGFRTRNNPLFSSEFLIFTRFYLLVHASNFLVVWLELLGAIIVGLMQIMYYDSAIKMENTFYCIWLIPISKDLNEL